MDKKAVTYGYARVSAKDQNLDRQLSALNEFGVQEEHIFSDKASGRDFKRPAYQQLLSLLHPGDVLVVKSIDRLGRNYDEILSEWRVITKEIEAAIVVLDIPLLNTRDTNDNLTGRFLADAVLQLLSYVAQMERENIRTRQAEGIAAAKARGVKFGRPPKKKPKNFQIVMGEYHRGELSRAESARRLKISDTTFDRWYTDWILSKRK